MRKNEEIQQKRREKRDSKRRAQFVKYYRKCFIKDAKRADLEMENQVLLHPMRSPEYICFTLPTLTQLISYGVDVIDKPYYNTKWHTEDMLAPHISEYLLNHDLIDKYLRAGFKMEQKTYIKYANIFDLQDPTKNVVGKWCRDHPSKLNNAYPDYDQKNTVVLVYHHYKFKL